MRSFHRTINYTFNNYVYVVEYSLKTNLLKQRNPYLLENNLQKYFGFNFVNTFSVKSYQWQPDQTKPMNAYYVLFFNTFSFPIELFQLWKQFVWEYPKHNCNQMENF